MLLLNLMCSINGQHGSQASPAIWVLSCRGEQVMGVRNIKLATTEQSMIDLHILSLERALSLSTISQIGRSPKIYTGDLISHRNRNQQEKIKLRCPGEQNEKR